jgi:hypothetical protein
VTVAVWQCGSGSGSGSGCGSGSGRKKNGVNWMGIERVMGKSWDFGGRVAVAKVAVAVAVWQWLWLCGSGCGGVVGKKME